MNPAIIIAYRYRGNDILRELNLMRIVEYWTYSDWPYFIVDDGRKGDEQFCRGAAYNKGALEAKGYDPLIYSEADMLIPYEQISAACELAMQRPGLVVPFDEYFALTERGSQDVRAHLKDPSGAEVSFIDRNFKLTAIGARVGPVNVVSRKSLALVGQWDEHFLGWGWDDQAMFIAFNRTCGVYRWIPGPAYHLYHLSGEKGIHLTYDDKVASMRNQKRYELYQKARTADRIRELTR